MSTRTLSLDHAGGGARRGRALLLAALGLLAVLPAFAAQARDLVVFGEPTLEAALRRVGASWRQRSGVRVNVFVAPGDLSLAQIERGARCDIVFAIAGPAIADAERKGTVKAKSVKPLFRNGLVLVGRPDIAGALAGANRDDPASLLGGRKLAIANPDRDLAGAYGARWLRDNGIREDGNVIVAENSAGVLTLLDDKMADLGIVYASDAAVRSDLTAVRPLASESHPAIEYAVGEAVDSQSDVKPFFDFLGSAAAKSIFMAAGLQAANE